MSIDVKLDTFQNLSCREEGGIIVGLIRSAIVTASSPGDFANNATAMQKVLDANGLPAPGSVLNDSHPNLILVDRSVVMHEPNRGSVRMTYEYFNLSLHDQRIVKPNLSLRTITADRLQHDQGDRPFLVDHKLRGHTIKQLAQITAMDVEIGWSVEVAYQLNDKYAAKIPFAPVPDWVNHVNTFACWDPNPGIQQGNTTGTGPLGSQTVLCTGMTYRILDYRKWSQNPEDSSLPNPRVAYTFSFKYSRRGWRYKAQFRDPTTGLAPQGLTEGRGTYWVDWHPGKDFNQEEFAVRIS